MCHLHSNVLIVALLLFFQNVQIHCLIMSIKVGELQDIMFTLFCKKLLQSQSHKSKISHQKVIKIRNNEVMNSADSVSI